MTFYHDQCYKCFCSTRYEEVDDGSDDKVFGSGDCGCDDPDEQDNFDDDDYDD